eukprot:CAMPEP_0179199900 /NCGR_PEP_ID=MMETSP0796-20121207/99462_1 /TAXON_ID=73915 /ORGANISM="Pyrodinium bahamense, Strain pbaha01" /LENGTH=159 /DNA_ID=CAMNT_0020904413 /DNA_START=98 /DNA_END=574 /DNA_ORIENTATION=-
MLPFVVKVLLGSASDWVKFCLVLIAGMAVTLTVIIVPFTGFHLYLASNAITTIEYLSRQGDTKYNYNQGLYRNLQAVFGANPLFWLLPAWPPEGDGATFPYVVWQNAEGFGVHVSLVGSHLPSRKRSAYSSAWIESDTAPTCIDDMREHCIEADMAGVD